MQPRGPPDEGTLEHTSEVDDIAEEGEEGYCARHQSSKEPEELGIILHTQLITPIDPDTHITAIHADNLQKVISSVVKVSDPSKSFGLRKGKIRAQDSMYFQRSLQSDARLGKLEEEKEGKASLRDTPQKAPITPAQEHLPLQPQVQSPIQVQGHPLSPKQGLGQGQGQEGEEVVTLEQNFFGGIRAESILSSSRVPVQDAHVRPAVHVSRGMICR